MTWYIMPGNRIGHVWKVLNSDLQTLNKYFTQWKLHPNPNKTDVSIFHLNNKQANHSINVTFCGRKLTYNPNPKYLGVTLIGLSPTKSIYLMLQQKSTTETTSYKSSQILNRVLTYLHWEHLLSHLYIRPQSTTPHIGLTVHALKIYNSQLNHSCMLKISGTLKSTLTQWLPMLCNIGPPALRRKQALLNEWKKCTQFSSIPIHSYSASIIKTPRLKCRKPHEEQWLN